MIENSSRAARFAGNRTKSSIFYSRLYIRTGIPAHAPIVLQVAHLIDISNGGSALIEKNKLSKGRLSTNGGTAISIGAEGDTNPSGPIVVRDNNFVNQQERPTVFVRNFAATPASLTGNVVAGAVTPLAGAGTVQ
jgi:hypothetical protein